MPDRSSISIARVPLARAPARLLAAPALLLVTGAVAAAGGVVVGGVAGVGLVAFGFVVAVLAIYLALIPFTVRLDVEVAALRLRWLGGDRRFGLVRGPVTRIPLLGDGAARLRPRFGALGWALGPARLRGSEQIQLVRLARSPTVILVPTDAGRLAIAAESEGQLLAALEAAARVQQRLDEVAGRARAFQPEPQVAEAVPAPVETEPEPDAAPSAARMLTGIERTLLEERLTADRAVALAAAEAERRAAAQAAVAAEPPAADDVAARIPAATARRRRRRETVRWRRPAWLRPPALPRPATALSGRTVLGFAFVGLPLAGAAGIWIAAAVLGRLDLPEAQLRAVMLALVLAGPVGSVGGLMARAWFPRMAGLVVVSAAIALVLAGRALLG